MARPRGRRTAAIGGVLAVGLLSACSSGWAGSSVSAASTAAAGSTVARVDSLPSAAPVAGTPSAAAPSAAADPSVAADPTVATDPPAPRTTDVVLGFVGWDGTAAAVEGGGYLSSIETGGTCTLVLTKGTLTVSASAPAQPDASTTACGNLSIPRSRLTAGTWSARLRYRSATTTGTSDASPVGVPQ